jgi:hypothetical protein
MRSRDCALKFCPRRNRTSLSRSCALLCFYDASERLQNAVKPLVNGLNKAKLPDSKQVTSLSRSLLSLLAITPISIEISRPGRSTPAGPESMRSVDAVVSAALRSGMNYSKREMAIRRSSARRRYSSCMVRSARSWSVVCGGSESISFSMASMSVATDASFSFKRSEGACGMANSLPLGGRRYR